MKSHLIIIFLFGFMLNAQDLSKVYERVNPAVVVIFTQETNIKSNANNITQTVTENSLGSGFLISNSEIITATHVVTAPENLQVLFVDGEIITAKVVYSFECADIALIKLDRPKKNAVTVSFGDSDLVKVGQQVFIVGAPFGIDHSLSSGYVSGFKRQSLGENPFTNTEFIQTDAAINQGNSGGPMFNLNGEVIGIVSHIASKSGGFEGIGYASSSNLAANLLLNNKMPWLGADLYTLTGKEAEIFNLPQKSGLLVQRVVSSSVFGKMEIKGGDTEIRIGNKRLISGGDIILAFNDIKFELTDKALVSLAKFAKELSINPKFEVTIIRAGKIITLKND